MRTDLAGEKKVPPVARRNRPDDLVALRICRHGCCKFHKKGEHSPAFLLSSGSIQTFASHLPRPHLQMFESQEPLANDMFLVELLTLTFENEACCEWVSNVKVAPLGFIFFNEEINNAKS